MAEVTVSEDRIPLPEEVRSKLGIDGGDHLFIEVIGHVAVISQRDPPVFRGADPFLPTGVGKARLKTGSRIAGAGGTTTSS